MKIGILGGGQLGKMFLQQVVNYPVKTKILDPNPNCSCAHLCDEFVVGDFNDYQTVLTFGQDCEVISIEIEHISVKALKELQKQGKKIIPSPEIIELIQDKGLQKDFYKNNDIPTADYFLAQNQDQILEKAKLPFVQKLRTGGYDGKGVQVIKNKEDLKNLWDKHSVIENLCEIKKELAVIFASKNGELAIYPPVEMVFDPQLNLVEMVKIPAEISPTVQENINNLVKKFAPLVGEGIFAIELFLTNNDELLVNETAPRVHNSGHLSIEACYSSQFDQMARILIGYPLGNPLNHSYAAMFNLIGAKNGKANTFEQFSKLLKIPNCSIHWYGKDDLRIGRKMGHLTVIANSSSQLNDLIQKVRNEECNKLTLNFFIN